MPKALDKVEQPIDTPVIPAGDVAVEVVDTTLAAPANDAFAFLPDDLRGVDHGQQQMRIPVAQGLHGCWVTYLPTELSAYEAMGVHICKVGDGTVTNEDIFTITPEKYLRNGDAVVGVMKETAYQNWVSRLREQNMADTMAGVKRGNDRPAGFPPASA